jgi:hypothetical protein
LRWISFEPPWIETLRQLKKARHLRGIRPEQLRRVPMPPIIGLSGSGFAG